MTPRHKGAPPPAYFDWRGWYRVGFLFLQDDMTGINALTSSSWISTGGNLNSQPYPSTISCHSGSSKKKSNSCETVFGKKTHNDISLPSLPPETKF
ncbi:hypothetical protein J6590_098756, partial [Homalodisca vitripennis]